MFIKLKNILYKNKKAFTLIEMLVVLVVVALLMAIIIPNVAGQRDRIQAQAKVNIAEILETQVNTYKLVEDMPADDTGVTLKELEDGGYITAKQSAEAQRLLELTESIDIALPINTGE